MQIVQGSLCSRNAGATYGLNHMNALVVCPHSSRHHGAIRKTNHTHSQRLQSIKEIMHRSRVRKRAGEEHHGSKLASGIQKGKADQIVLNGGSELGRSHKSKV